MSPANPADEETLIHMKSTFAFTFGLAAVVVAPSVFADEATSTTTTTEQTTVETPADPPVTTTNAPAMQTTTMTSTTTERDEVVWDDHDRKEHRPHVKHGLGLNVFGAAGSKDAAASGLGGRVEFVLPLGITLGASYQQSFGGTDGNKTSVRPLLGEIGWSLPVGRMVEVRPMVGLGYAFVSTSADTSNTADSNQVANASVATAGFDVAPGAKISFLPGVDGAAFELYTLPKYHFISGTNFAGIELGAGARF
jgi:hypothetical protein